MLFGHLKKVINEKCQKIQAVSEILISLYRLILVQMILNFNSVCSFFFFSGLEMPISGKEKTFCVLEYAQTQMKKTMQCVFVSVKCKFGQGTKSSKRKTLSGPGRKETQLDMCHVTVCRLKT